MKFFKYLFVVIYLLWSQQLAASECENFEDKVLSIPYPENGMVTAGEQAKNDLGIFFHQEFDYDKDVIKIRRDKNNMASNSRFYDDRPTLTPTPQLHTITPFYPPFDTLS